MYKNTNWIDHVVDVDSGEVIQEGTEQSAENFNNMERGIGDASLAIALMQQALRNESATNRIRIAEAYGDTNVETAFSSPDGFTPENSIVLSVTYSLADDPYIYMLPAEGWVRFYGDTVNCFVPHDHDEVIVIRIAFFRYK